MQTGSQPGDGSQATGMIGQPSTGANSTMATTSKPLPPKPIITEDSQGKKMSMANATKPTAEAQLPAALPEVSDFTAKPVEPLMPQQNMMLMIEAEKKDDHMTNHLFAAQPAPQQAPPSKFSAIDERLK